jgi:hemerythrin-like domain-containing protein
MSAIEILVDEHRSISRMVNVLTILQKRLESDDHADVNLLTDVVDFFRMFVDRNHHAKEEDALFPTLERRAVNPEGCTIQSLKSEHEQARILTTALADAIGKYRTGDPTAKSKICTTIKNSIDLYNDHIWRENILLFPMAEKALQESDLNYVTRSYGEIEKSLGADFRSKYEQLVNALEKITDVGDGGASKPP